MPRGRPRNQPQDPSPTTKPELKIVESPEDQARRLANQRQRILREAMQRMGRLGRYPLAPEAVERLIEVLNRDFSFMVEQLRHGTGGQGIDDIL